MNVRGLRKIIAPASPVGLPALGLGVALLSVFRNEVPHAVAVGSLLLAAAAVLWVAQARTEYIRRNNDPTWILKYQDKWDDAMPKRKRAAAAFLVHWQHRSEIDEHEAAFDSVEDVLDLLEDVGFYIQTEQISAEVAHNHLYHWIRVWWLAARPYVEAHQQREPTRWDHLAKLYAETSAVEKSRTPKDRRDEVDAGLDEETLKQFLEEERDLPTDDAEPAKAGPAAT
jgi:hypothetical protein